MYIRNTMMKCTKIGITGGTGSGKSTVCSYLRSRGFQVLDSDKIARAILSKGTKEFALVAEHFGEGVICPSGDIDRKKLASIVFESHEELKYLENVVTKGTVEEVRRRITRFCDDSSCKAVEKIIFVDAPILFETGLDREMDFVWMVHSMKELRIDRLAKRDGLTPSELEKRMSAQMPEEIKISKADFVIENNGTMKELEALVEDVLYETTEKLQRGNR